MSDVDDSITGILSLSRVMACFIHFSLQLLSSLLDKLLSECNRTAAVGSNHHYPANNPNNTNNSNPNNITSHHKTTIKAT